MCFSYKWSPLCMLFLTDLSLEITSLPDKNAVRKLLLHQKWIQNASLYIIVYAEPVFGMSELKLDVLI